jgi:hypothetical protein
MPVRSLNSSVFKWPGRAEVDRSARAWAARAVQAHPEVSWLAYFGSYARGDWGVGSDLDLLAVVTGAEEPFERRALAWNLTGLPVPAELLIYTEKEWRELERRATRFVSTVTEEAVTLYRAEETAGTPPGSR